MSEPTPNRHADSAIPRICFVATGNDTCPVIIVVSRMGGTRGQFLFVTASHHGGGRGCSGRL